MQNKLQELTDKLYNEGLSKGKQEAEQLVSDAKNQASEIIAKANQEAQAIIEKAKADALELKVKTENDVKMATNQVFASVKQQIESVITTKAVSDQIKSATSDVDFIKTILSTVVSAFNPNNSESVALDIILPANLKEDLEKYLNDSIQKNCKAGVNIQFSKSVANGFKIGPKAEGYMISFTDQDFNALIQEYLRPKTKQLLFGE